MFGLLPELSSAAAMRGPQPWLFAALAASQYDYASRNKSKPSSSSSTTSKPVLHALALDFTAHASTHASTSTTPSSSSSTTTPSSPVQMPLELILAIIEIAASSDPIPSSTSDVHLFKTCSLVCKAWSLPVQKLLFQNVTLRSRKQYGSFVRAVNKRTEKGRVLADAVRKLNMTIDYAHPSSITQRAFAHAVSTCPRLQHLDVALYGRDERLAVGPVGEVDDGRLRRHAPSFTIDTLDTLRNGPRIESLALKNWTENQDVLFQLLDVYSSSVTSLSLSGSTPSSPPSTTPWSGQLTSLHTNLQTAPSTEFMSWLLDTTSTTASLRDLTFEREPCPDLFEWVMRSCGRDLRSLSLPSLPAASSPASSSPSSDGSSPTPTHPTDDTPYGIEICERLEVLRMDRPHVTAHALKSVPRTVKHLVVGLDKDTSLQPVIDLVKSRGDEALERVDLRLWTGGEGHKLVPILKIACAVRGVELGRV